MPNTNSIVKAKREKFRKNAAASFAGINKQNTLTIKAEDCYEAFRNQYTNGYLQECARGLEFIELNLLYTMKEFSFYVASRINYRPSKDTSLRLIFFTQPLRKQYIDVFVSLIKTKEEAQATLFEETDDPEGQSMFSLTVRFDERLIKALQIDGVHTVEDFMASVPQCCEYTKLKKILWEELNHQDEDCIQNNPSSVVKRL